MIDKWIVLWYFNFFKDFINEEKIQVLNLQIQSKSNAQ